MPSATIPDPHPTFELFPHHSRLIEASAISPEVARARGYRSITTSSAVRKLGFSERQARAPALLIPVWGVHGEIVLYQARPDDPRMVDGKALKYETPAGARMALDVPPLVRDRLANPACPLFITEGARKADAAVSKGLLCVALLGVWNWRGSNAQDGKTALPDWEAIALNGRRVYICFDSDVSQKAEVHAALARLKSFLESRKAWVSVIYLPPGEGGKKVGLDDYFAQGGTVEKLLSFAEDELRSLAKEGTLPYEIKETGLNWLKPVPDGIMTVPLTNFTATIKADVLLDDGAESRREFEIEAKLKGQSTTFAVQAALFPSMNWAGSHLGAEAIIYPGQMLREHARCAVQMLSKGIQKRTVFAHTGWRKISEDWVYLHAGGAIGKNGPVHGIEVKLPENLKGYSLPPPPRGETLRLLARESLKFLEVAPARITVPLFGARFRAILGPANFAVQLSGGTGGGKTALAALLLQAFGPALGAESLPADWHSTGNSLEEIAFTLKDSLFVVDDFKPGGSRYDIQRAHREADRYLRAQRNRSGRVRMRADGSLRLGRAPRGLTISTGEETPWGQSLRAGMVILEVKPPSGRNQNGDVDFDIKETRYRGKLTPAQEAARSGAHAQVTAAFLRWFAPRFGGFDLEGEVEKLTDALAMGGVHKRTPKNLAQLALGLRLFLDFASEVGAIKEVEKVRFWEEWKATLTEVAEAQSGFQTEDDPVLRFLDLIRSAVGSGRAHVASTEGGEPSHEGLYTQETWGWRRMKVGTFDREEHRPQGERIGWVEGEDLYLEPEASFTVAQGVANDQGKPLEITAQTLGMRLKERGFLMKSRDARRQTIRVRITVEGRRTPCLHLSVHTLLAPLGSAGESLYSGDQPAQSAQFETTEARVQENLTTGQSSGQEKNEDLTRLTSSGKEVSEPLGRLVSEKTRERDLGGELRDGEGELVGFGSQDLTRKPDQTDQQLERGFL